MGSIVKYHNNMNLLSLRKFTSREISLFYTLCTFMKDKGADKYEISFEDLKNICSLKFKDKDEFYQTLKELHLKIQGLVFLYEDDKVLESFVLFPTFIIFKEEEYLTISLNKDYEYFLNRLTNKFTLFDLQVLNSLKSSYSKNLFRFLKQYGASGEYRVKIDQFRILMDIPVNYQMGNIDQKVIKPAIKELTKIFKNLRVTKNKKGVKVTDLLFEFTPLKKDEIDPSSFSNIELPEVKPTITCPYCNQSLHTKVNKKTGEKFYGHQDYQLGICKKTFSTLEEIESHAKKKIEQQNDVNLLSEIEKIKSLNDPRVKILNYNLKEVKIDEGNSIGIYKLTENLISKLKKILNNEM